MFIYKQSVGDLTLAQFLKHVIIPQKWQGWKAPVKASVSGVSLLQLSPRFRFHLAPFPQKRLILRLLQTAPSSPICTMLLQTAPICTNVQ